MATDNQSSMALPRGSASVVAYGFASNALGTSGYADYDTGLYSPAANELGLACGGTAIATFTGSAVNFSVPVTTSVSGHVAQRIAKVSLAAVDTGGGVFAWQNPTGATVYVNRVVLFVTTASSGACTVDVGYTATSAVTSADNLIDGLSVATAGVYDNLIQPGTNGKVGAVAASGKWITGSVASGASSGLVGHVLIFYTT